MLIKALILATPTLPILSALLAHLLGPALGQRVARLSVGLAVVTFLCSVGLLWAAIDGAEVPPIALTDSWGILKLDPLGSLMSTLIAGISMLVHMYSKRYMVEERGYARFFSLLSAMTGVLLFMVAAADLLTLVIGWHLVGVLLYFLLGHETRRPSSYRYGFWTLITYRIGDIPLVLAAVLLYHAFGTWSLDVIFAKLAEQPDTRTLFELPLVEVVGALVAFAAYARSAQFFFHTWLPYTMDGPTPVSALMHAGIVNAGGFLINRFAPVYVLTGDVLHWVFIVGLVTAVAGSVLMLIQNDIKKSLGYSTMGQMGFMVMETGVGAFSLAVYHLIAHGLFKGTLFLGAGSVINEARHNDGVPKKDLYTFVVEREPAPQRKPWLVMAGITLLVPMFILVVAHWLVEQDYFQKQGAIVLLFFGWVTGAQLIFTTYRMRTTNIWRLIGLILISFTVVVVGYTLIAHAFGQFLYPDPHFREQLYVAAGIPLVWFEVLVILVTLVVVLGWLLTYYTENSRKHAKTVNHMWINFYGLISREFYINDIYTRFTRSLFALAERLNVWLRWN